MGSRAAQLIRAACAWRRLALPLVGVVLAFMVAMAPSAGLASCQPGVLEARAPSGAKARFQVELADDDRTRALGLMNRPSLPRSAGMLFVYPRPVHASFWMKNTLIPLDMLFADETGRVTKLHSDAVPLDETPIDGGRDIRFVLEINGGLARRLGLVEGTVLRHPAIAQDRAAWPCE